MENLGWTIMRISLGLVVLGILITIVTLICRKILEKLINRREYKRKKSEEERLSGILAQWDPAAISIFQDIRVESDIYYLDNLKILRKYPLKDFCNFVFPESDKPPFWIIETKTASGNIPRRHTALVYDNPHKIHWHIAEIEHASQGELELEYRCYLNDSLGHFVVVRAKRIDILYTYILCLVRDYESVADIWLKMLQKEAVPILLASKDSMGGSPAIESVRKLIEGGPEEFFKNPVPD